MTILLLLNVLGIGLVGAAILVLFSLARRRAQLEQQGPMERPASLSQPYTLDQAA